MKGANRQKILLMFLIIVVLGAGAYYYLKNSNESYLVESTSSDEPVGADIIALVQRLDSISIDPSVLSNLLFSSLRDYSAILTPENKSRPNPFAPIGSDSSVPTTAQVPSGR